MLRPLVLSALAVLPKSADCSPQPPTTAPLSPRLSQSLSPVSAASGVGTGRLGAGGGRLLATLTETLSTGSPQPVSPQSQSLSVSSTPAGLPRSTYEIKLDRMVSTRTQQQRRSQQVILLLFFSAVFQLVRAQALMGSSGALLASSPHADAESSTGGGGGGGGGSAYFDMLDTMVDAHAQRERQLELAKQPLLLAAHKRVAALPPSQQQHQQFADHTDRAR